MPLTPTSLASGLESMTPTGLEQEAIAAFANAWSGYFAGASVAGVPAVPGSFAPGITAMQGAMVGFSLENAGAAGIQAGITAFWGAISPLAAAIWPPTPPVALLAITPPPGVGTIATALLAPFAQNKGQNLSLHDAASNIANTLHGSGGLGAFATGTASGSPVSFPIA